MTKPLKPGVYVIRHPSKDESHPSQVWQGVKDLIVTNRLHRAMVIDWYLARDYVFVPVLELHHTVITALIHIYALAHYAHRQATPDQPHGWQFELLEHLLKDHLPPEGMPVLGAPGLPLPSHVRVKQCRSRHYWYATHIGEVFKVLGFDSGNPNQYEVDLSPLAFKLGLVPIDVGFIDVADTEPVDSGWVEAEHAK